MPYHSTRGAAPLLPFDEVLLAGLATDGGLYLPVTWPTLSKADIADLAGKSYQEIAVRVMTPYLDGTIPEADFAAMVADAYSHFDHEAVAPLVQLGSNDWLLELFHGPTLSFKDYALQLVGPLFEHVLQKKGRRVTIVTATSGDTGSAAIEACRGREGVEIVVLHPHGRTSDIQRLQMTSVIAPNVHNLAIQGTFDDCQALVKALFGDAELREKAGLSAMNSINWARIMAQIVYYFVAAVALGAPGRQIAFSVPTGNFGNVFAAYAATRMGLPVSQLVIGSNANDILTRFIDTGEMTQTGVVPTLSPSMDIQVSSNFERYLFDLLDGDAKATAGLMARQSGEGKFELGGNAMARMRALFDGAEFDDQATLGVMKSLWENDGYTIDPHSAIAVGAARARRRDHAIPMIAVGTAHPAKFPDAVERATGKRPALPARLADLSSRPERLQVLPNSLSVVKDAVRGIAKV